MLRRALPSAHPGPGPLILRLRLPSSASVSVLLLVVPRERSGKREESALQPRERSRESQFGRANPQVIRNCMLGLRYAGSTDYTRGRGIAGETTGRGKVNSERRGICPPSLLGGTTATSLPRVAIARRRRGPVSPHRVGLPERSGSAIRSRPPRPRRLDAFSPVRIASRTARPRRRRHKAGGRAYAADPHARAGRGTAPRRRGCRPAGIKATRWLSVAASTGSMSARGGRRKAASLPSVADRARRLGRRRSGVVLMAAVSAARWRAPWRR